MLLLNMSSLSYAKYIEYLSDFKKYMKTSLPDIALVSVILTSPKNKNPKNSSVRLDYQETLTEGQIVSVTNAVNAYVPPVLGEVNIITSVGIDDVEITDIFYKRVTSFNFEGSKKLGDFGKINIIACKKSNENFTCSARLYDMTNNKVISEQTGINITNDMSALSLGTVSDVPQEESILELQCKLDTSNQFGVTLSELQIIYFR